MKRLWGVSRTILYFILTNIAIMVTVSVVLSLLEMLFPEFFQSLGIHGTATTQFAVWALVWGFAGSFISLFLSKFMAKSVMKVQVIDPHRPTGDAAWLVQSVHTLARQAGLKVMPEVGVYPSPDLNAFATGPSRNNSLVAVSTGLLQKMNKEEIEGVLAHEVAHIANGDMVGMTLVQGVVNSFVLFFSRILAYAIGNAVEERYRSSVQFALLIVFQILFGILGSMVTAFYSRKREFRADAGGARYAGRGKMIAALQALSRNFNVVMPDTPQKGEEAFASLKIFPSGKKLQALLSTHPPLEIRIRRLERATTF
jgi:heat shock protein HtpX